MASSNLLKTRTVPRHAVAHVADAPPLEAISGDGVWSDVPGVILVDTVDASPARFRSEVRACWTDDGLHLLFLCEDSLVFSPYTRRDEPVFDAEAVELFIGQGPQAPIIYREFELSPFNVQWDGRIENPTGLRKDLIADVAWNARSFQSDVKIEALDVEGPLHCSGWSARISIAFADLSDSGQAPASGDVWRANFLRIERRPQEQYLAWSPTLRDPADFHVPERFGELVFQK